MPPTLESGSLVLGKGKPHDHHFEGRVSTSTATPMNRGWHAGKSRGLQLGGFRRPPPTSASAYRRLDHGLHADRGRLVVCEVYEGPLYHSFGRKDTFDVGTEYAGDDDREGKPRYAR